MRQNKLLFTLVLLLWSGLTTKAQTYYINENFSTATGATPPTGWTQNVITGSTSTDTWRFNNPGSRSTTSNANIVSPFAVFDADNYSGPSTGPDENTALESPAVSTLGASYVKLKWDQVFRGINQSWGGVYVEVHNGTTWNQVYFNNATSLFGSTEDIDVSAFAANKAAVKVRFRYNDNWGWYWVVDNVQLYSVPPPAPTYNFIKEPFTTASGTTPPAGWSNSIISGLASEVWRFDNPGLRSVSSPFAGNFAIFDSDWLGNNSSAENVALVSPVINTTGFSSNIKLKWNQNFNASFGGTARAEVFDGSAWVAVYTSSTSSTATQDIDITSLVANKTTCRVRFRWTGDWSMFWAIDNVEVYAPAPTPVPNFTINSTPQCLNANSFTYTNASTIPGTASTMTYSWNFGDATNSTATSPTKSYSSANTYTVTLTATSDLGVAASTSKTVTVNANTNTSVSIAVSPSNSFCPGTNATFTATPTGGGASPAYQWKKNGSNVGTNSATYADNTLTTGDVITCVMSSNATCPLPAAATSNGITINTSFPASVSIGASTTTSICAGTSVNFTAVPTNGGTTAYQWKLNGGNVGTNSNTYTVAPGNGDVITCQMTSSIACASPKPATSNALTFTHVTPAVPSVTITKNPSTAICPGTAVSFTVTPTNGGPVPTYQWKLNGVNVATTNNWGSSSLNNGDVVSVVMTPNMCTSPSTATASTTMSVNPIIPASVTIAANPGTTICSGTSVTFTATPTGGGTPTYQWKKNGVVVGTNSATYAAGTTLTNGNTIECVMTSSATCAVPKISNSNLITMNVNSTVTPSVTISTVPAATACVGGVLQFVANPLNGGNTPSYQWKIDGNNVGTNFPSYTDNGTLTTGAHTVSVTMTSSITQCITGTTATGTLNKTISPLVTPTVSIASTQAPGGDACVGSSVTFTPTVTNAGTPTYQWKKNGSVVATGSSYAPGATLVTGDIISCEMTSTAACASPVVVNSAPVNITVWPNVTAAVTITSNPGSSVSCTGLPVTFTAATTNVGSNPTYQWKLNGNNVGTNSATYVNAALATGNTVSCVVTTSIPCSTPKPATSNTLTMTMNPNLTASINVTATPDSVGCEKTPFTFNTFHTGGGTNPAFKWYKNGSPIPGAAQAVYSSNSLADGDTITCELISNAVCTVPVMSAPMSIEIIPSPVPTLSIYGIPDDQGINFVATLTNGGQEPTFQWRKNGHDIQGASGATYKGIGLNAGDQINVFVHADAECANPEFLLSNTLDVGKVTAINTVTSSFNELTLFPNPNNGTFTVKGTAKTNASTKASVEVLNAVGQVVYKNATELRGNELEVNVNLGGHNAAGMYMLRVTVDGHTDNLRFVVKD
ncbi:PKD domain-containing protein [Polluticoccus soli]|uniref:PKD domain-containing protein n=1 Tax=Polluticoccus soli TaxID=3034150 RepID=UPI0023E0E0E6|nr:PKD domain-containing protein [Flavipsychrobacter sp. JY13-12]